MSSSSTDFETASISEWAQYCSHRDFCEVFELTKGSRFDLRATSECQIRGVNAKDAGCATAGKFTVCAPSLPAGKAAFVEIVQVQGNEAIAIPLVFLEEKPPAPAFVQGALFPSEKLVFGAQHGSKSSVLTTQRALAFESGALCGWVNITDALLSRHAGSLVIHGKDEQGFATAVSFSGLYSPLSVERLLCGLKAASSSASLVATEKPEEFAADYFGVSVESTIFNAVVQSPGISLSQVSHTTDLNRYLCRSVLRGLYLEGKVVASGNCFYATSVGAPAMPAAEASGADSKQAASSNEAPFATSSEEAAEVIRSFEELAALCYRLSAKQKALERQVDSLHAEVRVLSQPSADLSDLKLHMNRLESELASTLRKLDTMDNEYQTNIKALSERQKWAVDKEAHLTWANRVVSDKAQRKISEYKTYLSSKTKKTRTFSAKKKK